MPDHEILTDAMNAQARQFQTDRRFNVLQEQIDALKRRIEVLEGSSKPQTKKG